ncbi:MAG: Na/Pi cotransporter family protein, partial [Bdellovibrionota bacterium]
TLVLQSSGAVTSMLVGLGSARVINLRQVMGVIIGTAIGSTLTVQLISLNITEFALPLIVISFFVYIQSKKVTIKNLALVGLGFGLLFFGLRMMSVSAQHFAVHPMFQSFFQEIKDNPAYSLLFSMVFCSLVHSSSVTIGLAMSLASVNVISSHDAILWVFGANIGTTSTALMAAAGSNNVGKQVAWAHFFYKTLSVVIFYPFTQFFLQLLQTWDTNPSRVIANAHFIFNMFSAAIFLPFINKAASVIEGFFPKSREEEFGADFLNLNNYQNSALAVSYANREIMRTADIVLSMIKDSVKLFDKFDPALVESIKDRDNKVDFLYREIKMFLLDHANKSSAAVHQNIMNMIMFLSDLERAADSIDINILALAIKKNALRLEFSQEGWDDIKQMFDCVLKVADLGINAYQMGELRDQAIVLKRELARTEVALREKHIGRLNKGFQHSINTSSIHLDLLSEYRRVASLICNHAYQARKEEV